MTRSAKDMPVQSSYGYARRFERVAALAMYAAMVFIIAGSVTGHIWLWAVSILFGFPAAYLLNFKCHACGWPLYRKFSKGGLGQDWMFAPVVWPPQMPDTCSRCGTSFFTFDAGIKPRIVKD